MSERPARETRRADAVRNRERVIAAAAAEFTEHGLDAGIPEIAARAGVGKGTIYRNFESKDELLAAVVATRMDGFDQQLVAALAEPEPEQALRNVLRDAATRTSAVTVPLGISWPLDHPQLNEAKARVMRHMSELFAAGQAAGSIRKDATPQELFVLFSGAFRALKANEEQDPEVWRRHADLALDAFRPLRTTLVGPFRHRQEVFRLIRLATLLSKAGNNRGKDFRSIRLKSLPSMALTDGGSGLKEGFAFSSVGGDFVHNLAVFDQVE